MLDNFGEICKTEHLFDSSEHNLKPLIENAKVHVEESAPPFGEVGSIFSESEEEGMRLQLLLEEPKYSNILDTVLDIHASNAQKNFYVNEYLDSTYHKADDGVLNSSFTEGNKTVEQFLDGLSEENFSVVSCEENSHFDACKDYLLDVMFDERAHQSLHSVLNKEIYMDDDTKFDNQKLSSTQQIENSSPCHFKKTRTWLLPNFNPPDDNSHIGQNMKIQLQITSAKRSARSSATRVFKSSLALSSSSEDSYVPRLEATYSQNNLRVDEMSSDKLRKVFQKLFGRQTIITDEQWLRHHISLGLQKSDKWKNNLTLEEFSIPNENKGVEVSSATKDLLKAPSPFSGVFSFKRKKRVQRVKKKQNNACCESFRNTFFALERNSECGRKKPEICKKHTKDNVLHDASKWQHYGEGSRVPLQAGNEHFRGCTEVPRDLPFKDTTTRNEGHEWVDHSNKRHEDNCSNVYSDSLVESLEEDDDAYTGESEDDTSENEWKTEKIQHHRKNHFWSLTEVMNLVQGVSKYGVGRWIQIKRLFFRSSPHRTPADLKDKWRNLLSASCGRSQKRRNPSIPAVTSDTLTGETETKWNTTLNTSTYSTLGSRFGRRSSISKKKSQSNHPFHPGFKYSAKNVIPSQLSAISL